ncbi:MAG: helix-turn-helix domain-containing protein [Bacteroidaceae bacterium]|nr:helix-turn-helix domain-containing protein [Bacteroidaceae bacterium]
MAEKLVDILAFVADKEQITTEALVRQFGYSATTTKRYLQLLTELGYLEAQGGEQEQDISHQLKQLHL